MVNQAERNCSPPLFRKGTARMKLGSKLMTTYIAVGLIPAIVIGTIAIDGSQNREEQY